MGNYKKTQPRKTSRQDKINIKVLTIVALTNITNEQYKSLQNYRPIRQHGNNSH